MPSKSRLQRHGDARSPPGRPACDTALVALKSRIAVAAAAALVAIGLVLGFSWYRSRAVAPAALLARLPTANSLLLSIDFEQLRRAGILQLLDKSKSREDPDYVSFVEKTNFNYRVDLDLAVAAFAPTGKFLLLTGRFDWKALRAYAASQGGRCDADLCRMQGSTPDRRISFFPLRSNLMALAVSPDDSAALRLNSPGSPSQSQPPDGPIWLSIPMPMLRSGENLPDGTRAFARSVGQAEAVTLTFKPEDHRLAARLNVLCRNELDAADVALQLQRVTTVLREMIARENQKPNPADLSGVLTAGSFHPEGRRVLGYWPIERVFIENILAGTP